MLHGTFLILRWFIAWLAGAITYFLAVVCTVYDGFPSLIFQPFCAAFVSVLCVAGCVVVGLPLMLLRRSRIFRLWGSLTAGILVVAGAALLLYSVFPSHLITYDDPATHEHLTQLGGTAMPGYFAMLFALSNWPYPFAPSRHA